MCCLAPELWRANQSLLSWVQAEYRRETSVGCRLTDVPLNGAGARRPARQGFGEATSEAPLAPTAASPLPLVGSCVDLTTRARGVKARPRAQLSFSASHGQAEKRHDGSRDVHPLVTGVKLRPDVISFRCLGQHVLTWKRFGEPVAGGRSKGLFRRHPLGRQTVPASSLGKRGWTGRNQGFPLSD